MEPTLDALDRRLLVSLAEENHMLREMLDEYQPPPPYT